MEKSTSKRYYSIIAIIGFTIFLSVLFLMHFVHTEFTFSNHFMSEYVNGEHGWILNIAFAGNLF